MIDYKFLEEQTGQVLLIRDTPPRATSAGRHLLKHYLQVKRLEDDLHNKMCRRLLGEAIPAL